MLAPKEAPTEESLVAVIPEADLDEEEQTKTGSYRKSGIGAYWDSLKEAENARSTSDGSNPPCEGTPSRERERPEALDVSDLFGDCKDPAKGGVQTPPKKTEEGARKSSGGIITTKE